MARTRSAAVAIIASALLLTSCSAVGGMVDQGIEDIVEGATDGKVTFTTNDDGSVTVETEEGTFSGGTSVPDSFPDDVPLPDATLKVASETNGAYQFVYEVPGADDAAAYANALAQADFSLDKKNTIGDMSQWTLSDDAWTAELVLAERERGASLLTVVLSSAE